MQCLQFNSLRPSLLGAGCSSGGVSILDVEVVKDVVVYQPGAEHSGSRRGVFHLLGAALWEVVVVSLRRKQEPASVRSRLRRRRRRRGVYVSQLEFFSGAHSGNRRLFRTDGGVGFEAKKTRNQVTLRPLKEGKCSTANA